LHLVKPMFCMLCSQAAASACAVIESRLAPVKTASPSVGGCAAVLSPLRPLVPRNVRPCVCLCVCLCVCVHALCALWAFFGCFVLQGTWVQWVQAAYSSGISLLAEGTFTAPSPASPSDLFT
jgi:hypothetical protein